MDILPGEKGDFEWNISLALVLVAIAVGAFSFGQLWDMKLHNAPSFSLEETEAVSEYRLDGTAATIDMDKNSGKLLFEVVLPDNRLLPSGAHLEGWLGTGDGPMLSAGEIIRIGNGKRYSRRTDFGYNLSKYTKAFITLEFAENTSPGTVIMQGNVNKSS